MFLELLLQRHALQRNIYKTDNADSELLYSCVHLGLLLGVGAHMQELRRVRSGAMDEVSKFPIVFFSFR